MFHVQPCQAVSSEAVRVFSDHTGNEDVQSSGGRQAKVKGLVQKLQQAVERLQAGGEIPCHFSTLTTAIYHWQDLAKILEKYEVAVTQRRQGRSDPLEPAERKLSAERRRVLKYPGVVAWFTGYKMELFYKHVLKYEDGEGVFEWGAGGIMHLHSINFGAQMPRVDPAQDEWRLPCPQSIRTAQDFAQVHEEYVTDWSLSKAEKWSEQDIENAAARRTSGGSPLHSDAESDGSEDLECHNSAKTQDLEPKNKRARVFSDRERSGEQEARAVASWLGSRCVLSAWVSFRCRFCAGVSNTYKHGICRGCSWTSEGSGADSRGEKVIERFGCFGDAKRLASVSGRNRPESTHDDQ
jgi:hypothetical protein